MNRTHLYLAISLGLAMSAQPAMAHINVFSIDCAAPCTRSQDIPGGWNSDAWADGLLLDGAGKPRLGDSHRLQNGGVIGNSNLVASFTFNATAGESLVITVTQDGTPSPSNFMNPAFTLYQGAPVAGAHDNLYPDPLNPPLCSSPNPDTAECHAPGDWTGRDSSVSYVGQFNPCGHMSMSNGTSSMILTYTGNASDRGCPTGSNQHDGSLPVNGKTERGSFTAPSSGAYTILVGGERCQAQPPYASALNCANGGGIYSTNPNFGATVTLQKVN
ncbi:MAG: hypothetical protein PHE55_16000 [Methylococcaceae bacterium]|nr:hypothetical protein [Methylococcaceae bacterium]